MSDFAYWTQELQDPKKFKIGIFLELDYTPKDFGFDMEISKLINGCIGEGDYETIESSIKDKIDLVSLPTEEFVPFIATENGHWEGMEFFRYYKFERVLTEETEEKQIIIKVANKMRSPERINEVINIIEDVSGNIDYEEEVKKLEDCRENLEVFLLENYIEGPVVCEECEK